MTPCSRTARARGATVLVTAVLFGSTGCTGGALQQGAVDAPAPASSAGVPVTAGVAGSALQALAEAEVKGRAPTTGYTREQFGQAWSDVDRNGCDTRNDVLRRDVSVAELKAGTQGCVVATGVLDDPYSGTQIVFQRGEDTSSAVQIDHVVSVAAIKVGD